MKNNIKIIGFDADDTLWVNEPFFREAEKQFCELLEDYLPQQQLLDELFKVEMKNLPQYGYGVKGFVLSMIETANKVSNRSISPSLIDDMIAIGQDILQKPVELLPEVTETLEQLNGQYQLIMATKGDLLGQERKLKKSGLGNYFQHIEIMSDKKTTDYEKLLKHLGCKPDNFLMLGNSIKSDILPVLELGGYGAHIPYHITWIHEAYDQNLKHEHLIELNSIDEILHYV